MTRALVERILLPKDIKISRNFFYIQMVIQITQNLIRLVQNLIQISFLFPFLMALIILELVIGISHRRVDQFMGVILVSF